MLIPSFTASTIRSTANNFLISSPGENKGGSGKLCMRSSFSGIRGHNMHHKVKTFCMEKGSLHSFEKINLTSLFYRAKPFGKGISSRSVPVGKRLDSNLFCAALRRRKKKTRRIFFSDFLPTILPALGKSLPPPQKGLFAENGICRLVYK